MHPDHDGLNGLDGLVPGSTRKLATVPGLSGLITERTDPAVEHVQRRTLITDRGSRDRVET